MSEISHINNIRDNFFYQILGLIIEVYKNVEVYMKLTSWRGMVQDSSYNQFSSILATLSFFVGVTLLHFTLNFVVANSSWSQWYVFIRYGQLTWSFHLHYPLVLEVTCDGWKMGFPTSSEFLNHYHQPPFKVTKKIDIDSFFECSWFHNLDCVMCMQCKCISFLIHLLWNIIYPFVLHHFVMLI